MKEIVYVLHLDNEGGIVLPEEFMRDYFVMEGQKKYLGFHESEDGEVEVIPYQDMEETE